MDHSTLMGYAAKTQGQALEPIRFEPPELGRHDVRVSVTHCGVCNTDIQAIQDYFGITKFPFVPGHEIVGSVSEIGSDVSCLKVGERVGIGWQGRSCHRCDWCLRGDENLCQEIDKMGSWEPYGGFSGSVVVEDHFAYPLPVDMPSELAAVLMCAGITVYSPLRLYAAQPALRIGIIGVGGLGHLAIQYAHAFGYEVTAISTSVDKREQALAFGADHFIYSGERADLRQANYSLDLLLCTGHDQVNWEPLLMTLKKKGRLILVGFPDVTLNSTDLVAHELSITGSFLSNRAGMREMLSYSQTHAIRPMVELMPMTQVNEALRKVKENRARYRVVLVNDQAEVGS